ncbi:MAG: hypothetical protein NXI32_10075 [bacterium]|nr:hypothetical protein [bacterium]
MRQIRPDNSIHSLDGRVSFESERMDNEAYDVHPLDRDDDDPDETYKEPDWLPAAAQKDQPRRPLLKPSLVVLGVSFAVAFLSGVVAANSQPMSIAERTGSAINRIAVLVMLAAFCGVLFSYRYEYLRGLWLRSRPTVSGRRMPEFVGLLILNLVGFLILWACLLLLSFLFWPSIALLGVAAIVLQASLSATMAVYGRGIWRGFAIGYLVAALLLIGSGASTFGYAFFGGFFNGRGGPQFWGFVPVAILHLFLIVNGLVSAAYAGRASLQSLEPVAEEQKRHE